MRRLPIYFVIDISESMAGQPLKFLEESMNNLIRSLRTDPEALEKVFISIIAFAGRVRTLCPLTELFAFYPPKLPLGSGTAIGAALDFTAKEIKANLRTSSYEQSGDYKPIVYFLSDGGSTDAVEGAIERWKNDVGRFTQLIAVGIGKHADLSIFQPISEEILRLENTASKDFAQFIQWITLSVSSQSRSVGTKKGTTGISLEKAASYDALKVINNLIDAQAVDENFVILTGQCSQNHNPYLLKYKLINIPFDVRDKYPQLPEKVYEYAYSCPLDQHYYEWSARTLNTNTINVNSLIGGENCPQCNNPYSIALCSCGQLICVSGEGKTICPSCQEVGFFYSDDKNQEGFDITRNIG